MKPYKILIVEDQLIVQMHLQRIVREMGHQVTGTATGARQALDVAAADPPDLVLMDIHLAEGSDGIDAARMIRERHDCAVVFVTAYADAKTVERSGAAGAAGYVVKPFTDAQVHAAIVTAMVGHTLAVELRERERRFEAVVAGLRDAVVITDPQGRVTFMNPRAVELTGQQVDTARGRELYDVVHLPGDDDRDAARRAAARALEMSATETVRGLEIAAQNRTHEVSWTVEPVTDAGAGANGLIITLRP